MEITDAIGGMAFLISRVGRIHAAGGCETIAPGVPAG